MPNLSHERELQQQGFPIVAGIDEAGRGPLAGPVVAAAVILPEGFAHDVLNDSKRLSPKKREEVFSELIDNKLVVSCFSVIDAREIDRINILRATWKAMAESYAGLTRAADIALIDGKPVKDFPGQHKALVKGDSLSLSIAAASVIAKVERDRLMLDYAEKYPEYGFERHKGYGTKLHLEALAKHGPCPIHRRSFSPVAEAERK